MNKMLELLRTLKAHKLDWKNEVLMTSIQDDIKIVREIIDYQAKKSNEKRVVDKLDELSTIVDEIENELKAEEKKKAKKVK